MREAAPRRGRGRGAGEGGGGGGGGGGEAEEDEGSWFSVLGGEEEREMNPDWFFRFWFDFLVFKILNCLNFNFFNIYVDSY